LFILLFVLFLSSLVDSFFPFSNTGLLGTRAGHNQSGELLLAVEDVGLDRPDNNSRTPLACDTENGHNGVMKRLLGREGGDVERPDNNGQIPLS